MNTTTIDHALQRLGQLVDYHAEVDLFLVGGAAGMLTGVLPPARTTTDCDVMVYLPPGALAAVELAAASVAQELGLPERWLNSDVQIRRDTLPEGWQSRRILVGAYGRLRVFAASRLDLIAMKIVAGRVQDLEDLRAMRVRRDEAGFVRSYLDALAAKGASPEQIDDAREVLDSLRLHDHE